MINKGREKLAKNLDLIKQRVTALKNKEPAEPPKNPLPPIGPFLPQPTAPANPEGPVNAEPLNRLLQAKRGMFADIEAQIDAIKSVNADDSALNDAAKQKQAVCMQTMIETRVKLWCLSCANKEAG